MMLTHLDLFSGIGGFALAARWAGLKTVQFVEIDPFCQKVLRKNFEGLPIHDDIKTFTYAAPIENDERERGNMGNQTESGEGSDSSVIPGNQYDTRLFLLTGGFPCQPFSCAGKRRGKEDDRFLWPEMLRVVSEAKPDWVIGENVAGFINMGLDDCISDLENQGYEVQAFVIPACAVGAPHRRDRVWIVAHTESKRSRETRGDCERSTEWTSSTDTTHHATDSILQGPQRRGELGESETRRTPAPRSGQDTAGCDRGWNEPWLEAATRLCRVDARVSNRVDRLKSLGNAIVPQVAFEIMKSILEVDDGSPGIIR